MDSNDPQASEEAKSDCKGKKNFVLGVVNTSGMKSASVNRKRRWDQPPEEDEAAPPVKVAITDDPAEEVILNAADPAERVEQAEHVESSKPASEGNGLEVEPPCEVPLVVASDAEHPIDNMEELTPARDSAPNVAKVPVLPEVPETLVSSEDVKEKSEVEPKESQFSKPPIVESGLVDEIPEQEPPVSSKKADSDDTRKKAEAKKDEPIMAVPVKVSDSLKAILCYDEDSDSSEDSFQDASSMLPQDDKKSNVLSKPAEEKIDSVRSPTPALVDESVAAEVSTVRSPTPALVDESVAAEVSTVRSPTPALIDESVAAEVSSGESVNSPEIASCVEGKQTKVHESVEIKGEVVEEPCSERVEDKKTKVHEGVESKGELVEEPCSERVEDKQTKVHENVESKGEMVEEPCSERVEDKQTKVHESVESKGEVVEEPCSEHGDSAQKEAVPEPVVEVKDGIPPAQPVQETVLGSDHQQAPEDSVPAYESEPNAVKDLQYEADNSESIQNPPEESIEKHSVNPTSDGHFRRSDMVSMDNSQNCTTKLFDDLPEKGSSKSPDLDLRYSDSDGDVDKQPEETMHFASLRHDNEKSVEEAKDESAAAIDALLSESLELDDSSMEFNQQSHSNTMEMLDSLVRRSSMESSSQRVGETLFSEDSLINEINQLPDKDEENKKGSAQGKLAAIKSRDEESWGEADSKPKETAPVSDALPKNVEAPNSAGIAGSVDVKEKEQSESRASVEEDLSQGPDEESKNIAVSSANIMEVIFGDQKTCEYPTINSMETESEKGDQGVDVKEDTEVASRNAGEDSKLQLKNDEIEMDSAEIVAVDPTEPLSGEDSEHELEDEVAAVEDAKDAAKFEEVKTADRGVLSMAVGGQKRKLPVVDELTEAKTVAEKNILVEPEEVPPNKKATKEPDVAQTVAKKPQVAKEVAYAEEPQFTEELAKELKVALTVAKEPEVLQKVIPEPQIAKGKAQEVAKRLPVVKKVHQTATKVTQESEVAQEVTKVPQIAIGSTQKTDEGPQEVAETPQVAVKVAQKATREPPVTSKVAQEATQTPEDAQKTAKGPHMKDKVVQEAKTPQVVVEGAQKTNKGPQVAEEVAQEGGKSPQVFDKSAQKSAKPPQEAKEVVQEAAKTPLVAIKADQKTTEASEVAKEVVQDAAKTQGTVKAVQIAAKAPKVAKEMVQEAAKAQINVKSAQKSAKAPQVAEEVVQEAAKAQIAVKSAEKSAKALQVAEEVVQEAAKAKVTVKSAQKSANAPQLAKDVVQEAAKAQVTVKSAQKSAKAPQVAEEVVQEAAKAQVTVKSAQKSAKAPQVAKEVVQEAAKAPQVVVNATQITAKAPQGAKEVVEGAAKTPEVTQKTAKAPQASKGVAQETTKIPQASVKAAQKTAKSKVAQEADKLPQVAIKAAQKTAIKSTQVVKEVVQEAAKTPQVAIKATQKTVRRSQVVEEVAPGAVKTPQMAGKPAQRTGKRQVVEEVTQETSKAPQVAVKAAQKTAKRLQMVEEVAQETSKTPQVAVKAAQKSGKGLQVADEVTQEAAETPPVPAKAAQTSAKGAQVADEVAKEPPVPVLIIKKQAMSSKKDGDKTETLLTCSPKGENAADSPSRKPQSELHVDTHDTAEQDSPKHSPITLRIYKDNLTVKTDLDSPKRTRSPSSGEFRSELSPPIKSPGVADSLSPQNKPLEFTLRIAKDANTNIPKATMSPKRVASPTSVWKSEVQVPETPVVAAPADVKAAPPKPTRGRPRGRGRPPGRGRGRGGAAARNTAPVPEATLPQGVTVKQEENQGVQISEQLKKIMSAETPATTPEVSSKKAPSTPATPAVKVTPVTPASVVTPVTPVPQVTPGPKKRGRPRKSTLIPTPVPEEIVIKQEPVEPTTPTEDNGAESDTPGSGRPKRTCRGRTKPIVVKKRKPRGGGIAGSGVPRGSSTPLPIPVSEIKQEAGTPQPPAEAAPNATATPVATSVDVSVGTSVEVSVTTPVEASVATPVETPVATSVADSTTSPPSGKSTAPTPTTPARGRGGFKRPTPDRNTLSEKELAEIQKIEARKEKLRLDRIAKYEAKKAKKLAKKLKDEERRKRVAREKAEKAEAAAPQVFEEETRMSAPDSSSIGHTPAPNRLGQPGDGIGDESQNSISTPGDTNKGNKKGRMEISITDLDCLVKEVRVDDLAEYQWQGSELFMIQEQVSLYLGVKSFKRKYPGLKRRTVEAEERTFLEDSGLVPKSMCDLGLTAVSSAEILDIMYHDFPEKYEEFRKHVRDKQAREASFKQKAAIGLQRKDGTKVEPREQALEAVAAWNANLNRERREERRCALDLQTFTVHYPKLERDQKMKKPTPKLGLYPVAVIPGQFCDYYKKYTPNELMYFPVNTVVYGPLKPNERHRESMDGSASDSSSSSSSSSSSGDSSSDSESEGEEPARCTMCSGTKKKNREGIPETLLICAVCKSNYHPACKEFTPEMIPHLTKYEWQCTACKKCNKCKDTAIKDRIMSCQLCDRGYHLSCIGLKKMPEGRWHCSVCAYCSSCGSRNPGGSDWQHEFKKGDRGVKIYQRTLCTPCFKLWRKGKYCQLCSKCHILKPEEDPNMIQCNSCDRWLHKECYGSKYGIQTKLLTASSIQCDLCVERLTQANASTPGANRTPVKV